MAKKKKEKSKKKVLVAVLNMGTTAAGLEASIFSWMLEKNTEYEFNIIFRKAVPTSSNRNKITKEFLDGDWDYLAMFDEDTVPLKNPFDLLDHDKDVIGCVYPGIGDSGLRLHVYKAHPEYPKVAMFEQYPPKVRSGLMRVDAIGTGAIMIKRKVLEKIKRPFDYTFDKHGVTVMSDDIAFCHRCNKAGFQIWTDWDYGANHYKTVDLLRISGMIVEASGGIDNERIRKIDN